MGRAVLSIFSPHDSVIVSSLCSFSSVGSFSKPSRSSLPLSLGARHIQEYFKKKGGRKRKFIKTQQEKARCDDWRKQIRVKVQAELVVGFSKLVPLKQGADNSAEQDTATFTKDNEDQAEENPAAKRKSN